MKKEIINFVLTSVKYDESGLVPVVIQDYKDSTVLMVAYMTPEALVMTIRKGKTYFYSRSRKRLWMKGEESGNVQLVKEVYFDCDADCLLIKVRQVGGASCHTGYRSCFYRKIGKNGKIKILGKQVFDPKKVYQKND